ncbi:MAG: hypothetical protein RL226_2229, partial [Bacteroidota bacterium]
MPESVLLACYDFPPNEGIGGRRWAKFAKGLAQAGYDVHVIKAAPAKGTVVSGWQDDSQHPRIFVHELPRRYPESVSHPGTGIIDKVRYRIDRYLLTKREAGTIYDIAIGWEAIYLQLAEDLIRTKTIHAVVATGAPFNLLFYTAKLRHKFPDLRIVVDYRDPWLTAQNYGMKDLAPTRMQAEIAKQEFVFANVDVVTCPNDFLLAEIQSTAVVAPACAFKTLAHFFDGDDLSMYLVPEARDASKIKLIYGGAIYMGVEKYLVELNAALTSLKSKNRGLYDRLQIDFYTPHLQHAPIFEGQSCVHMYPSAGKAFFSALNASDAAFIFLAHHNKDYLTTKFFEYLPFKKPLIYIGDRGYAAEFIVESKLGKVIGDVHEELERTLESLSEGFAISNGTFDISEFSLERRTR